MLAVLIYAEKCASTFARGAVMTNTLNTIHFDEKRHHTKPGLYSQSKSRMFPVTYDLHFHKHVLISDHCYERARSAKRVPTDIH